MWVVRRPKSELPATWAQSMLGALAVFALFLLVYGVVPHEWLTWCDSKLGLREDKILINTWMWIAWQKRGTAKPKPAPAAATPEPAGTSAFSRPLTKKD